MRYADPASESSGLHVSIARVQTERLEFADCIFGSLEIVVCRLVGQLVEGHALITVLLALPGAMRYRREAAHQLISRDHPGGVRVVM